MLASFPKMPIAEDVASKCPENRRFRLPHLFDAPSPEYPHKPYVALESMAYIFVADNMCLSSFKFLWWVMYFETECEMAVQGYPRSLILAPIERAYATSY